MIAPLEEIRTPERVTRFDISNPKVKWDTYDFKPQDIRRTVTAKIIDGRVFIVYEFSTGELCEISLPSYCRRREFPLGLVGILFFQAVVFLAVGWLLRGMA
jgi:hypothetical protein